ncbi:RNA dependent RNA polymerase [Neobacillus drentensis]|uniref:RNA dependent RNA polymerase n=1 Tax=Neobacillus drentensis TaxID=220684 RepID=UPI003000914B
MAAQLQNRVMVLSVSTDAFFNENEGKIAKGLMKLRTVRSELKIIDKSGLTENKKLNQLIKNALKNKSKNISRIIDELNKLEIKLNGKLKLLLESEENNNVVRELKRESIFTNRNIKDKNGNVISTKKIHKSSRVVALFESSLTRALNIEEKEVNDEIVIVKVYHYRVLKDLIDNGFTYMDEEYSFFSASSGQMKNKKCVFIKKSALVRETINEKGETFTVLDTLMCGLSWDRINKTVFKKGDNEESGININKFLAYLSLQNTSTTKWEGFDINKVVVCPDLEMGVTGKVEFINRDTYTINPPERMTLPMNINDGVGMILPELSDKAFQFRINFGKGLLVPFDFKTFAIKEAKNTKIVDVWGKPHDVIKDDVKIILSASQLKTWKYYSSMEEYRAFFNDYNCEAGKCNEEVETRDIHLNYQYIQSLTNMSKGSLEKIAEMTNQDIKNLGSDKNVMLRSLGATLENDKKTLLQQALLMYPNLLNDPYVKEMIKSKKSSMVTEAKAGKLRVEGKRMFVIPDLYGYCEFLFKGDENPNGLLGNGKVFARNLRNGMLDIMRSPALSREHGLAENIKSAKLKKWFVTGGLYVSNHSFLSRLLQLDFDGDQVNVCINEELIKVAEESMKGIYPLYYEMSTAPIQKIDEDSIYDSLIKAFGGQIGSISNSITKIWNSTGKFTDDKLKVIKLLTMYNNFMIDFSKTSFLPKPPANIKKEIRKYTKGATPYFFQYAKGKENFAEKEVKEYITTIKIKGKVCKLLKSKHVPVVNMLEDIIKDTRIHFKTVADKLDYKMLMSVNKIKSKGENVNKTIIKSYDKINKTKKWMIDKESAEYKDDKYIYIAKVIKDQIMDSVHEVDSKVTEGYVLNVLVEYLYKVKKAANKKTLWESFGNILLANLKFNLHSLKDCQCCGKEFEANTYKEKFCSDECRK